MAEKYCSPVFKCGEDLDKALAAALCSCDDAARAEAAAKAAQEAVGEVSGMVDRVSELERQIADMNYGDGIVITSFTHNGGNKEKGSTITELTLSWSYNDSNLLKEQKLEGEGIEDTEPDTSIRSQTIKALNITADRNTWKTWTLTATDIRDKTVSKPSPGFTFLNRVYYGAAEEPVNGLAGVDSAFILALSGKSGLTNDRKRTITVDGGGKYIWYCLPKSLGTCSFKDVETGFSAGIEQYREVEFNNGVGENGYTETYYVYQSNQKITGTKEIEVS